MNWDRIEGTWKQLMGKARLEPGGGRGPHAPPGDQDAGSPCQSYSAHQWGKLAADQLDVTHDKREQLVGQGREQYGIGKDEDRKQVDRSVSSFDEEGFEH